MNITNKTNRLIDEKSPYLLQHAYNPVEWFPWGDKAFQKAAREDKPVFLSIGYSTCHWCHVMEKESFEDSEIAGMMNEAFINIKVDREERPDIDSVYMSVCQMMTGGGGWPMTIIMTADKKPFYAGTYFPRESKWGRIGMFDLINQINDVWKNNRNKINISVDEIFNHLKLSVSVKKSDFELSPEIFDNCFDILKSNFDEIFGGFGNAPKFPSPHNLSFLLRYYKISGIKSAVDMVEKTLDNIYFGGIYDKIGFGFHRYSTDRKWLVPHFEKMLYDQAMIINTMIEAYKTTNNSVYKNCINEVLEYITRDMYNKDSGFFSAEDADSEGVEGKFYLWKRNEIEEILGEKDAELFCKIYNIEYEGNFIDEITKSKTGENILFLEKPLKEIADNLNISPEEIELFVNKSKMKLFIERKKRIHPSKDDKILTDWNAMMISSFAKAGFALKRPEYIETAKKSMDSLMELMLNDDNSLSHRNWQGNIGIEGNLDDYAYMIDALLELYFSTGELRYIQKSIDLTDYMNLHFLDGVNGGYFFSSDTTKDLIIRKKEIYDGAIPSGNSVALQNLYRLNSLTGRENYREIAERTVTAFSGVIGKYSPGYCNFLNSLLYSFQGPVELVIAGDKADENYEEMVELIAGKFIPTGLIIYNGSVFSEVKTKLNPLITEMKKVNGLTTVYLCNNFSCKNPVNIVNDLKELLIGI